MKTRARWINAADHKSGLTLLHCCTSRDTCSCRLVGGLNGTDRGTYSMVPGKQERRLAGLGCCVVALLHCILHVHFAVCIAGGRSCRMPGVNIHDVPILLNGFPHPRLLLLSGLVHVRIVISCDLRLGGVHATWGPAGSFGWFRGSVVRGSSRLHLPGTVNNLSPLALRAVAAIAGHRRVLASCIAATMGSR
ncbi:hypothetical protein F5B21DRAFT_28568 [Xylaria acuta]|nr:hypothetical protein F5B21DRAFT_28568 [Xylaria acuta]